LSPSSSQIPQLSAYAVPPQSEMSVRTLGATEIDNKPHKSYPLIFTFLNLFSVITSFIEKLLLNVNINGYDLCGLLSISVAPKVRTLISDWGGTAYADNCGICDDDSLNDCTQDQCGEWGGTGYPDECGLCDSDPSNDCVQDCYADWGGTAMIDDCGFCSGGNTALEYNEFMGCDGQ
jgi:hypothetical protein